MCFNSLCMCLIVCFLVLLTFMVLCDSMVWCLSRSLGKLMVTIFSNIVSSHSILSCSFHWEILFKGNPFHCAHMFLIFFLYLHSPCFNLIISLWPIFQFNNFSLAMFNLLLNPSIVFYINSFGYFTYFILKFSVCLFSMTFNPSSYLSTS